MNNHLHLRGSTATALQSRLFQNGLLLVRSFCGTGCVDQNLRFSVEWILLKILQVTQLGWWSYQMSYLVFSRCWATGIQSEASEIPNEAGHVSYSCSVFLQYHHTRCVFSFLLSLFFSRPLCETLMPKTVYMAGTLALCIKPQAYFFLPIAFIFFFPL